MGKFDELTEVKKAEQYDHLEEIEKFNPYHDGLGRFATGNGMGHFAPLHGKTPNGEKLLQQYKEKHKDKKDDPKGAPKGFGNTATQSSHKSEHFNVRTPEGISDAAKDTAKALGVSKKEAETMVKAVVAYSDGHFRDIRKAGRGEPTSDEIKKEAEECENLIKASPKWAGGELHRGMNLPQERVQAILQNAQEGKPIDLRGVSSWSSDSSVADDFADFGTGTKVILHTTNTQTSHGTSIRHISKFAHEQEVLVSKEAEFIPKKIVNKNGTIHVYGELP